MALDIRTLIITFGVVALCQAMAMVYASARRKTYRGFHLWTLAFIVNGTGMMLMSLRPLLPVMLTVIAANGLVVGHLSLIHRGVLQFTGRERHLALDILPAAAVVVLFTYFTYLQPHINARILIISVAMMLVYLQVFFAVRHRATGATPSGNPLVSWACLAAGAYFGIRAAASVIFEERITDFMSAGTLHGLGVMVYGLTDVLIMVGVMAMNSQQLETELREKEQHYRLLFDQSPVGIVRIDHHGVLVDYNETFSKILGVPSEQLRGLSALEKVQNPEMIRAIEEALAGRRGTFTGRYTSVVSQKTSHIRVLTQPIRTAGGDIVGAIGIFEDTSEIQRKEEILREKERLQGVLEMAGAVCHEMNQPLMAIMGYVELLGMDMPAQGAPGERLEKVASQVERLKAINTKLMKIARYETKSYLQKTIIDIDRASDRR